jgi:mannose-6-phosphate isomerase-like protein (cupin superfamily)
MDYSRRDLSWLLPALAACSASAQTAAVASVLPTKAYAYGDMTVKTSAVSNARAVMKGATHSGFPIELHITDLAPNCAPHPPHKHVHEEILMIHSGMLEVTMLGRTASYGPGSVIYFGSGDEHGVKNTTTERAEYFVIALGNDR